MSLHRFLVEYGYLAVLGGSLLEGETVLVLAGFAAHQGHLSLPLVIVIAFFGGMIGDQIFFFVGWRYGAALLRRMPFLATRAERVNRALVRHQAWLIIGVRFMYGLRIVGPIVIGMSDVRARHFLRFNMIGAAIWAVLVAGAGYLFGHTLKWFIADLERYEGVALLLIIAIAGCVALAHRWLARRKKSLRELGD
ncbi:MAG: DedA family protein [Proteobacteria bacterium]|nr:DedA family protein [Pseudomonadota bacterium]